MNDFGSTGGASRPRSTSWTLSSGRRKGSSIKCRRIWQPATAVISRSLPRPQSTAIPLAFLRYSPGQIVTPHPASRLPLACSTAQDAPGPSSPHLFQAPCRPDFRSTTFRHARCQARGETVMKTRRRRLSVRIPRAIVQQTRKWFSSLALSAIHEHAPYNHV